MRHVLKVLARRTDDLAREPFFEFLRDKRIEPRRRLSFVPVLGHFVMTFSDLYNLIFRQEPASDRYQELVNAATREDEGHWKWFLADLETLGLDPQVRFSEALKFVWSDATVQMRLLSYHMCRLGLGADALHKLVLIQCIEATGKVALRHSAAVARELSTRDVQQSLPRDVQQSLPRDVQQSLPRDAQQSLPSDVQQSLPSDVQQSLPSGVRQSLPRDVQQSLPRDAQQSLPRDVQQSLPSDVQQSFPRDVQQSFPSPGKPLVYFGANHLDTEADHTLDTTEVQELLAKIELTPELSRELSSLVDTSFALFTAFARELLEFARSGRGVTST